MKSTGVVRRIDELGRIVVPKEIRKKMYIESGDPLEIFVDGDHIILTKYQPSCIFCGNPDGVVPFEEKLICSKCIEKLQNKF